MNIIVPKHHTRKIEANLSAGIKGEYQIQVVNPDGSLEFPLGERFHKNIITNIGLERLLTTITSVTGAFNANYDTSVFNGGGTCATQYCRAGSGSTAAVATDTALQTQLTNPAPTTTKFTAAGGNATDLTNATTTGSATHKVTYQFTAVTGSVTINEIGLGWSATTASTLFSRFVTPAPINLTDGQILRVVYQLTISCPSYIAAGTVSVDGFSSNGFDMTGDMRVVGGATQLFGSLSSTASFVAGGPYQTIGNIFALVAQARNALSLGNLNAFPAVGSLPTMGWLTGNSTVVRTVTPGTSPYVDMVYEFSVSQPANTATDVRSIFIHDQPTANHTPNLQLLMDAYQTKSNEYKLQIGIRSGWTRI